MRKGLAIYETLGEQHPSTANAYSRIGSMLYGKGDLDGAVEYMRKALAIEEATLGEQQPPTATSYNNIGVVLHDKGDLDAALEYHRKALAIREATLGTGHTDTASSRDWVEGLSSELASR